jgi:low temperature requirement protein LtrA
MTPRETLLRGRATHEQERVTFVELFFDLVFVFAVTQLSHTLLENLTPLGALHTTLLMMAVWWVWIYTSWVTNWLDPDKTPVRLMVFVLMLAGLIFSTALPHAFEETGRVVASTYVFMQVGRSLFMLWALKGHSPNNHLNFQRIICWSALAGVFWLAGAWASGGVRLVLWTMGVAVEYAAPSLGFWTPRLGRSTTEDWDVAGGHLAERCALFIIIALGESVLVTGVNLGRAHMPPMAFVAFVTAFVGSVAMWWIYFTVGAEKASRSISRTSNPGRLARLAYTYVHLPLVAGIIVAAVGDSLTLEKPDAAVSTATGLAIVGGPVLYLLGNFLFKRATRASPAMSHLAGMAALVLLFFASGAMSTLGVSAAAALVLVVVAGWETASLGSARKKHSDGLPS